MLFLANPKKRRSGKSRRRSVRVVRRKKSRRVAHSSSQGGSMARRKTRRARRTVARRRRRSSGRKSRRFAAVRAYLPNPRRRRRRHYRRNPSLRIGGVVSVLKSGVKDGLVVLVSQAAAKRAMGYISKVNPLSGIAGVAVTGLGTAVLLSLVAKRVVPRFANLVAAAAFAEGLRGVIAASPAAPLFADWITDSQGIGEWASDDGYGAWPQIPASVQASGMGAWPNFSGVNDQEEMQQ